MRRLILSALTVIALAGGTQAATVTVETTTTGGPIQSPSGGILNIQTITEITKITGISQVNVLGVGVFTFPDLLTAPSLTETDAAIASAFSNLGIASGSAISDASLSFLGVFPGVVEIVRDITFAPGTTFIGDLDRPLDIIVVTGQVNVVDTRTQTVENRHLLTVTLAPTSGPGPNPPSPTPVPLPATAPLLLFGLGGLFALRRRSWGATR